MLAHSRELTVFTHPLPNSYQRFGCDEAPRYVRDVYKRQILYTHVLIIFKDFLCNFCAVTPGIHGLFFYVAVCLGFGHMLVLHKAAFCPADQPHLCDLCLLYTSRCV